MNAGRQSAATAYHEGLAMRSSGCSHEGRRNPVRDKDSRSRAAGSALRFTLSAPPDAGTASKTFTRGGAERERSKRFSMRRGRGGPRRSCSGVYVTGGAESDFQQLTQIARKTSGGRWGMSDASAR